MIKGGKTRAGLLAALGHLAIDLRYDERSARVQFLDATADFPKWTNSDDMYRAELRERIADKFLYVTKDGKAPLAFSKDRFSDVIDALLNSRRVDPFKAYLDAICRRGTGRSGSTGGSRAASRSATLTLKLLRWASYSVLMGAVARTYTPGEKHDEDGDPSRPAGARKIDRLGLAPAGSRPARQWFSDALKFHADLKAQVESLQGRVIVEAAEMSGSTRAEVESIKAFLARQERRRRPAHLPPRPDRPPPPLRHRRLHERPPLSPQRPLGEPPIRAGSGFGRQSASDIRTFMNKRTASSCGLKRYIVRSRCSKNRRGSPTI